MDDEKIRLEIIDSIKVTNHMVSLAKGFILNYENDFIETTSLIEQFVRQQGFNKPKEVILHPTVELESQISQATGYFSFSIAFCEAIHSLVNSGELLERSDDAKIFDTTISWTTVVPGSSGYSGGWSFKEFYFLVPTHLVRAFSKRNRDSNIFSDSDFYILELGINNAHNEVTSSLKESIECFRSNLFQPSITMLGKAVEGAWIELGISLANYASDKKHDYEVFIDKLKGTDSFVWKVNETIQLYERQDWFKPLRKSSGIDLRILREVQNWTDIIRDSRNAIHFGAEPATANTYDKASILLLGAVKHLRTLYKLKQHSDNKTF